ncbi:MAG: universal stress protein [Desertifilum sp. SIO1I2]|nr:universal stress protein [Desertifilum sp. SIO1I2]
MIETILVAMALDRSAATDKVFQTLQQIQLQSDAKVILAHILLPPERQSEQAADKPHFGSEESPYREIEKQLETYQQQLSCTSKIEIATGDPAEEIIRLANIHQANLIIIGSRGLTGVKRILEGSVSTQVVEDATCSVLVVKP